MTLIVGVPVSTSVFVLHVFSACLCGVFVGWHPGPGITGRVGAVPHEGHTSSAFNPALGPWERAKGVAADVGNDVNRDHVHVHEPHYPEQIRKEAR